MSDDYAEQAAAAFYDYLSQDERDEARNEIAKLRALLQEARYYLQEGPLCRVDFNALWDSELPQRIDEALNGGE